MDIQLLEALPEVRTSLAGGERGALTTPHIIFCQDVDSSPNAAAESAWNVFSIFMHGETLKPKDISKYSVAMIEVPKHGNVAFTDRARTTVDVTPKASADTALIYRSEVGYLGADSATFQVDSRRKKYLVTVNFLVQPYVAESNNGRTECTAAGMDKAVNPGEAKTSALRQLKLVAQASEVVSLSQSESSGKLADALGSGSNAKIKLDIAAADGKTDQPYVLLHEYGHVFGLENSADGSDFMAATLRPCERRLPTTDESGWTAQCVAELSVKQGAMASAQTIGGNASYGVPPSNSPPIPPAYPA